MPTRVLANGPSANHLTLDVGERQVLIAMEGEPENYWHHLLLVRIAESRWVTCDPSLTLTAEDLAGEEVVPLGRATTYPEAGRPILALNALDEQQMDGIRTRAAALAEVHGVMAPEAPVAGPSVWLFADTSLAVFGQEVKLSLVTDPVTARIGGSVGIVQHDLEDGRGADWVLMERVLRADLATWKCDKREGSGRDPRLSGLRAASVATQWPLFRSALSSMGAAQEVDKAVFEGPAAFPEVAAALAKSGLEPPGFVAQYFTTSGLSPKSSLGIEFAYLVHSLWLLACVDRLDCYRLSGAEHTARRILQIQRAVRRNPRSPDFDTLSEYMKHAADSSGSVTAPVFEKHVAERQRDEAQVMKQNRLASEEAHADEKRRKPTKGAGKGDKEKEPG